MVFKMYITIRYISERILTKSYHYKDEDEPEKKYSAENLFQIRRLKKSRDFAKCSGSNRSLYLLSISAWTPFDFFLNAKVSFIFSTYFWLWLINFCLKISFFDFRFFFSCSSLQIKYNKNYKIIFMSKTVWL